MAKDSQDSKLIADFDGAEKKKKAAETGPISERLRHDGPIHGRLINELTMMIRSSESHIQQRYDDWDRVDEQMRLYMDLRRPKSRGDKTEDPNKKNMPYKDSIGMPLIYSTVMTRVAVIQSQLTARNPRLHYEGRGSEDMVGARMHEAMATYDLEQSDIDLQIWQAVMDTERYGMAIWYDTWEEKWGYVPKTGISPLELLMRQERGEAPDDREFKLVKEWNNTRTIDPRDFRPDPNVPISSPQEMSYVGHKDYANVLWYMERQIKDGNGPFFNIDKARELIHGVGNDREVGGRWMDGQYQNQLTPEYPNLPIVHLQWKIVPKDWGLSENENPEIWWFSVVDQGNTSTIIRAHRSVYAHGEFTYSVAQPDRDAHAPFVPGIGQQLIGIQDTANWLVNSHIVQAKKIINDQIIFNDDLIDAMDMATPGPAKQVRLTKKGKRLQEMGQLKIQDMYGQFGMVDVTKAHLETMQFLFPQAQRMAATPDTIQGMPLPTKRTLGEVEQVNQSATLRLGQAASLIDKQLMLPMARRLIMNRQQFTSMKVMVRLSGRLIMQLEEQTGGKSQVEVGPNDLAGGYDYIPHTPTMAPDPARQTAVWGQLLQVLAQAPQLMNPDQSGQAIDPIAVFDEFVRSGGINYIDQFKKQVQPMPGQAGPGMMPPEQPAVGGQPGAMDPAQTEKAVQSGVALPG